MLFNTCRSGFISQCMPKLHFYVSEVKNSRISPGKWKSLSDYTILITGGKGGSGDFTQKDSKEKKKKTFQPLQKHP